jgi:L-alanine-DL-glutamate epimerase-like enolase superfamily enzyme
MARAAGAAVKQGFRRLKVKLAGDARLDWLRLKAVHSAVPKARLVADGNQGFSLAGAVDLARRLSAAQVPVYFFEQPFPRGDTASMRRYRAKAELPLVADESVRTAAEAKRLLDAHAIDGVNIKVAKSGLLESLKILTLVRRRRKILSIGCMEESKLGLAASVHLACGTGAFDWIDLDSAHLMKEGNAHGGFMMKGPFFSVR